MLNEAKVQKMIAAKQVKKQKGASMIEYALVIAVVVAIGSAFFAGTDSGVGKMVADKLEAAGVKPATADAATPIT